MGHVRLLTLLHESVICFLRKSLRFFSFARRSEDGGTRENIGFPGGGPGALRLLNIDPMELGKPMEPSPMVRQFDLLNRHRGQSQLAGRDSPGLTSLSSHSSQHTCEQKIDHAQWQRTLQR